MKVFAHHDREIRSLETHFLGWDEVFFGATVSVNIDGVDVSMAISGQGPTSAAASPLSRGKVTQVRSDIYLERQTSFTLNRWKKMQI